ncbi:CapA family protein [Patescibacteria group bacterium]|nr:CapA family protein [Patescibacteria group bacterium]
MLAFTKQYKSIIIFISLILAILLLGLYFFITRSSSTTIAFPLNHQQLVFIEIDNDELTNHLNEIISQNPDQYQTTDDKNQAGIIIDYETNPNTTILFSEPLVAIVNPQTIIDNIYLDQLMEIINQNHPDYNQIITSSKYRDILSKYTDIASEDFLVEYDYQQIIDQINLRPDLIGFIPYCELSVSVRPLSIDDISALKNPLDYPLQINTYVLSDDQTKLEQFLGLIIPLPEIKPPTNILGVGDIMMGRYVGVKISRSGDNTHSFEYVSDYLSKPDITFAQLETPISPTTLTSEGMILIAQPNTIDGLIESGIDIVSISGNHFGDALRDGMENTFNILKENNILYIGAGRNETEAFDFEIIKKNNTKFGFITFVNIMPSSYGAEGDIAGSAWVDFDSDYDLARVQDSIQAAKQNCDILIAGFHWGTEYTPHPTTNQVKFAHAAIDSGADLIIGTHPHVVQADEIYQGKYIIYSLGNFIMDQMWSTETTEGVLLDIYANQEQIISVDLTPTQIIDYSQVKIISKSQGQHTLQRIWDANQSLSQ